MTTTRWLGEVTAVLADATTPLTAMEITNRHFDGPNLRWTALYQTISALAKNGHIHRFEGRPATYCLRSRVAEFEARAKEIKERHANWTE
jgi:Fe2+ or Zn2+ uptake regulation protein